MLNVEGLARLVIEREALHRLVKVTSTFFVNFDQVKTRSFVVLLLGVAYFILVQAFDLVNCNSFHLRPIDAPELQFIHENLFLVLVLACRRSVFAA